MDAGRLLEGRRVIVVGGGGIGNGRGVARGVAAAGGQGAVVDINRERANESAEEINANGGKAHALTGDVRSGSEVDRLMSEAVGWLGGLDSLVTVVGGYSLFAQWTPLAEVSDDQWNLIIDLNLTYWFRFARAALVAFLGQGTAGSLVGIGS